jgi:hypothetical protein
MIGNLRYIAAPRKDLAMKIALALMLLFTAVSALAVEAQEEQQVCTAITENLEGVESWARVECDGPYAGKCLREVRDAKGDGTHWEIVSCK